MPTVAQDVAAIRTAVYGRDVREAIADGIENCYSDVSRAKTLADQAVADATQANNGASQAVGSLNTVIANAEQATRNANDAAGEADGAATNANDAAAAANRAVQNLTGQVNDAIAELPDAVNEAVDEETQKFARIDGYYKDMTVGDSEQLISSQFAKDKAIYSFRKAGGTKDIGNRAYLDKIVGGSVVWHQYLPDGARKNTNKGVTYTRAEKSPYILSGTASETAVFILASVQILINHKYFLAGGYDSDISIGLSNVALWPYSANPKSTTQGIVVSARASGTSEVVLIVNNGTVADGKKVNPQLFDLTQMFGSAIADYIYSLEQANAGAGVAWFRKLFPNDYYEYNAGELISVNALSRNTVGFNQWDEEWEAGWLDGTTGQPSADNTCIRSKNFNHCLPNTDYYLSSELASTIGHYILWYDASQNFISRSTVRNQIATSPANAYYFKLAVYHNGGTYDHNICINLSHSGYRNGEYEAYEKHSYPMADIDLRGILKLDENHELYYDGDEYLPEGKVKRKYGIVDLGTLTWAKSQATIEEQAKYYWSSRDIAAQIRKADSNSVAVDYIVSEKYSIIRSTGVVGVANVISVQINGNVICSTDMTSSDSSKPTGYLVYELATPTEETVDPFTQVQVVDDFGTEEFVTGNPLPVYAETSYPINLRDKLQHLPSLAEENGRYLVKQTGTQMELVKATPPEDFVAGNAEQLIATQYVEDSVPYKYRTTGGGADVGNRAYVDKIVGGSVVWNQLVVNGNFANGIAGWSKVNGDITASDNIATLTATSEGTQFYKNIATVKNHVYLLHIVVNHSEAGKGITFQGTSSSKNITSVANQWTELSIIGKGTNNTHEFNVRATVSVGNTIKYKNAMMFDLTQMFGSAVADHIHSLGDAGVALFRSWFPDSYYEYNAGELISIEGLRKRKTVGFNQWDEEWESGAYSSDTGLPVVENTRIRSKNPICVLPSTDYYCESAKQLGLRFYDENDNFLGSSANRVAQRSIITTPTNAYYMRFSVVGATTYNANICINLSRSGTRNGEYTPYESHEYPLDSSLTLRGIPKLVDGKVKWDGDEYLPEGKVNRKYGIVDLGTLAWNRMQQSSIYLFTTNITNMIAKYSYGTAQNSINIFGLKHTYKGSGIGWDAMPDDSFGFAGVNLRIRDDSYTDAATFKTAMSGVYLVYELATPTEEEAEPFNEVQIVDDWGTEEFISDSIVPVGHETRYPANLRDKLQHLPDLASGDGDYMIQQSGSQMTLVPSKVPQAPTANGTYVLKVTVSGGTPTYKWEAAT